MGKYLREKQKALQKLNASMKDYEMSYQESKRSLEEAMTIEDAAQCCRNGEMSISEYKEFKDQREALEMVVSGHQMMKSAILEAIQKNKDELHALKKEQKKKLTRYVIVILLCMLSSACGYFLCGYMNNQALPAYKEAAYKEGYAQGREASYETAYNKGWNNGYDAAAELAQNGAAVLDPVLKRKALRDRDNAVD